MSYDYFLELPPIGDGHWRAPVANAAALPAVSNQPGDARVALDTGDIYVWTGSSWFLAGGGSGISIGETVSGGYPNGSLLYVDTLGKLANDTNTTLDGFGQLGLASLTLNTGDLHISAGSAYASASVFVGGGGVILSGSSTSLDFGAIFTDGTGVITANEFIGGSGYFNSSITGLNGIQIISGDSSFDGGAISTDGRGDLYINGFLSADGGNVVTDGLGTLRVNTLYMAGYIADVFLAESIDPNGRSLYNSSGTLLANWSGSWLDAPNGLHVANGLSVTSGSTIIQNLLANGSISSDSGTFVTDGVNGKLSIYNGNTTDGNGVTAILKSIALTAQSASIGSTSLIQSFTPATGSHYRVSVYLVNSVAGTGTGTVTATIGWNDGIAARTVTSAASTFGTLAAPVLLTQFMVINNTSPTYSTTVSGTVGTSKYNLYIDVEKVK